jgi:hypothetical protein
MTCCRSETKKALANRIRKLDKVTAARSPEQILQSLSQDLRKVKRKLMIIVTSGQKAGWLDKKHTMKVSLVPPKGGSEGNVGFLMTLKPTRQAQDQPAKYTKFMVEDVAEGKARVKRASVTEGSSFVITDQARQAFLHIKQYASGTTFKNFRVLVKIYMPDDADEYWDELGKGVGEKGWEKIYQKL